MKVAHYFYLLFFTFFSLAVFAQKIDSLETVLQKHTKEDSTKVIILNQLAWENRGSNFAKALRYITEGAKISKKITYQRGLATGLSQKALIFNKMGNYMQSVEIVLEALKIFEQLNDQEGIAFCFIQIGITKVRQGYYKQGIDEYRKAYQIFVRLQNEYQQARILNNIGNAFTTWQKPDSALFYLRQGEFILEKTKNDFRHYIYYNQSVAHFQKKQYSLAEEKALKVLIYYHRNSETADKYIASKSFINLSDIYFIRKEVVKSLECMQEGLQIAKKGKLKPEMQEAYSKLANLYAQKNQLDSAYYFQSLGIALKDSLSIVESQEKLLFAQETHRKDKQAILVKLQKEEIEKQRLFSVVLLILFIILIFVSGFIFRSRKRIKNAYRKLHIAKIEIEQKSEELKTAFESIEEKNLKIKDSITYAQRIQNAMLPFSERIEDYLGKDNFFILYKPRDIVSGDFYFFDKIDTKLIVAAADCTGHGVPGAFMSMIGMNILVDIVSQKITEPDQILEHLHQKIRYALKQEHSQNRDGMDIAICTIDYKNKNLDYAGAKNPLYLVQNNELIEIKADKKAIGGQQGKHEQLFTKHRIELLSPSYLYIFSDGYQDQFGGQENKKFMVKRFRELLFSIHQESLENQKQILDKKLQEWKGTNEQTDDILVIGIKI